MENQSVEMFAFIYEDSNGNDVVVMAEINGKYTPLTAHLIEDIEAMSSLAINVAAEKNLNIKLAKFQKTQEVDFGYFIQGNPS